MQYVVYRYCNNYCLHDNLGPAGSLCSSLQQFPVGALERVICSERAQVDSIHHIRPSSVMAGTGGRWDLIVKARVSM